MYLSWDRANSVVVTNPIYFKIGTKTVGIPSKWVEAVAQGIVEYDHLSQAAKAKERDGTEGGRKYYQAKIKQV